MRKAGVSALRRPVVDDFAGLQRDGARAIAQRVFDLMQRNQNGDAVARLRSARISITRRAELGSSEAIGSSAIDEFGALHERAGDGGALLLSAG